MRAREAGTRSRVPRAGTTLLAAAMIGGAILAACGGSKRTARAPTAPRPSASCYDPSAPVAEPSADAAIPAYEGPMPIVETSKLEADLKEVGLDVRHLPPLEKLDHRQLGRVMKTFSSSLGIKCIGCHDLDDFAKWTPRKRVAKHMWDDFVRVLALDDGSPLYCDSCHQGLVYNLDRRDKKVLASYMDDVFVARLKRQDGKDHDCGSCHGDPPDFHFIRRWKKEKP